MTNAALQLWRTIHFIHISHSENSSDKQLIIDKIHDFGSIIFKILHILEYIVLSVRILLYTCKDVPQPKSESINNTTCSGIILLCKCLGEPPTTSDPSAQSNCNSKCFKLCIQHVLLSVLFVLLYLAVILPPPILYRVWPDYYPPGRQDTWYTVTQFGAFFSSFFIRIGMISITVIVIFIWGSSCQHLPSCGHTENAHTPKQLVDTYDHIGELARYLHNAFQEWFVVQWIIYFLEIAEDCYFIYDHLREDDKGDRHQLVLHILYLVYRIFTFAIPYSCGLLMNHFHKKYHESIQEEHQKILERSDNESMKMIYAANLIPEKPKYNFLPSLFGISIPLNATGHALTIVLTMLAFILSLVTKSVTS